MDEAVNLLEGAFEGGAGEAAGASAEAVVRCVGLTKVFRDFWFRNKARAVDGVDLEIRRGEVFGLLGPNGSGKSTTIKMILGLLHPTSGRVQVFGKRADDVATKRLIGYLPEESYLYRFLNAHETLDYYGRLFGIGRGERRRRVEALLEMVGLGAIGRRPVGEYSKGMQRRMGLAQALINDPQLVILDEPTSGLDPIGTKQFKDLIVGLANRGKTILLCSHLLADVEDVCGRVAIMYGGKVRAMGTVGELLTKRDTTTIQTETLDAETIGQLEAVLESRGKHIERVEHPRQKLESLFLEIVERARAEGAATSGATAGTGMAGFLVSGGGKDEAVGSEQERVIGELMGGKGIAESEARRAEVAGKADVLGGGSGRGESGVVEEVGSVPGGADLGEVDRLVAQKMDGDVKGVAGLGAAGDTDIKKAAVVEGMGQVGVDRSVIDELIEGRAVQPKAESKAEPVRVEAAAPLVVVGGRGAGVGAEEEEVEREVEPAVVVGSGGGEESDLEDEDGEVKEGGELPFGVVEGPMAAAPKPAVGGGGAGKKAGGDFDAPPTVEEMKLIHQLGESWVVSEGGGEKGGVRARDEGEVGEIPVEIEEEGNEKPDGGFLDAVMRMQSIVEEGEAEDKKKKK